MAEPRFARRQTRQVIVGNADRRAKGNAVPVGGGAPIAVQSMTITKTADVDGTLAQIYALSAAGADIVRCTCNEREAAEGLAHIVPRSPVPIVADIHFHIEMALAALEANVDCLRLNPGNLRKPEENQVGSTRMQGPRHPGAHRRERRLPRPPLVQEIRRGHPRSLGGVGPNRVGFVRRRGLRRREDLGQGVQRAAHD